MKQKPLLMMLGMATMLASCSQDELDGTRTDGTMTITATVDNGIGTRASTYDTDDVDIDQCLLEVYGEEGLMVGSQITGTPGAQEGTFTFTVSGLDPDTQYDFLFWADNKEANAYRGSLKDRRFYAGADYTKALAFQGKIEDSTPEAATAVTLTHAVAKVTLNTTGEMAANDAVTLTFTGVAESWDVSAGTATGSMSAQNGFYVKSDIAQPQDKAEVTTLYLPAPALGSTNDVRIDYTSADGKKSGSTTVTNVPFKANFRTVLTGDIAALYKGATANITASLDDTWSDPDSGIDFPQTNIIETTAPGQITSEAIKAAAAVGNGTVVIKGPFSETDLKAIAACDGLEINLDFSEATLVDDGGQPVTEFPHTLYRDNYADKSKAILTGIILPNGIKSLSDYCFIKCDKLTSITLPEGLETLGLNSLSGTGLTSVDFPESLTTIKGYVFNDSKLEGELVVPANWTFPSESSNKYATTISVFNGTNITSAVWNSASPLQNHTFSECKSLKTVTINNCGGIDYNAFGMGCTISTLIVNMTTPPEIGRQPENGFTADGLTSIKVPAEAVETYKAAEGWSQYEDIITAID